MDLRKMELFAFFVIITWQVLVREDYSKVQDSIADFLGCSFYIVTAPYNYGVFGIFFLLSLMYLFEIKMAFTTIGLFASSLLIFSHYENYLGGCGEWGLIPLVFLVQSFAYLRRFFGVNSNLNKERIQFSLQILAAAYTLSGIAKLRASGMAWFTDDAENFVTAVLRYHYSEYVSTGILSFRYKGEMIASFMLENLWLTKILLGSALFLECGAFVLLLGKKHAFLYGVLIVSFHIAVFTVMNLFIPSFAIPILSFTINPLYLIASVCIKAIKKE